MPPPPTTEGVPILGRNTRALLDSLEQLRDSLAARVQHLSVAVERLRTQAGDLERVLWREGDRIEVVFVDEPAHVPVDQSISRPAGNQPAGVPSPRRTRNAPPPTANQSPPTAINAELSTLSRPLSTTEIQSLLDRASQLTAPTAPPPERVARARTYVPRTSSSATQPSEQDVERSREIFRRTILVDPTPLGNRYSGIIREQEPEVAMQRSRSDIGGRAASSISPPPTRSTSKGMQPTNIQTASQHPAPVVVRSIPYSPASTIRAGPSDASLSSSNASIRSSSIEPTPEPTTSNQELSPALDTDELLSNLNEIAVIHIDLAPADLDIPIPADPRGTSTRDTSPLLNSRATGIAGPSLRTSNAAAAHTDPRLAPLSSTRSSQAGRDSALTYRGMDVASRLGETVTPRQTPFQHLSAFGVFHGLVERSPSTVPEQQTRTPPGNNLRVRGTPTFRDALSIIRTDAENGSPESARAAQRREADQLRSIAQDIVRRGPRNDEQTGIDMELSRLRDELARTRRILDVDTQVGSERVQPLLERIESAHARISSYQDMIAEMSNADVGDVPPESTPGQVRVNAAAQTHGSIPTEGYTDVLVTADDMTSEATESDEVAGTTPRPIDPSTSHLPTEMPAETMARLQAQFAAFQVRNDARYDALHQHAEDLQYLETQRQEQRERREVHREHRNRVRQERHNRPDPEDRLRVRLPGGSVTNYPLAGAAAVPAQAAANNEVVTRQPDAAPAIRQVDTAANAETDAMSLASLTNTFERTRTNMRELRSLQRDMALVRSGDPRPVAEPEAVYEADGSGDNGSRRPVEDAVGAAQTGVGPAPAVEEEGEELDRADLAFSNMTDYTDSTPLEADLWPVQIRSRQIERAYRSLLDLRG